ncbi:MAG: peptide MFS transporter [Chitinispirillaceae bacterium]|nr:peptide MFS transporter [Chitinispirillaceae bacterium]
MKKKHPAGLWVCFMTELWERFGFYSLLWLLVLYMDHNFAWTKLTAGWYYGTFLWAVFAFNFIGGWIADRFTGQIKAIKTGAFLMILGYCAVAFSSVQLQWPFTLGLILVSLGTGLFKGNISVMVGNLYAKENEDIKDAGYNIYYMGINIGALLASIVISYVFKNYNYSFWAAAVGMVISIITFSLFQSLIQHADVKNMKKRVSETMSAQSSFAMSKSEARQRIVTLMTLFLISIIFWVCYYQNGSALTYFADKSTVKTFPPQFYSFFNCICIIGLTLTILPFYRFLNRFGKEPSTAGKIFWGMVIMAISMVIMVAASIFGGNGNTNSVSSSWLISTYVIVSLAEILISPMGLSFVSKVAPPNLQGLMMGAWFFATGFGGFLSGLFSAFYDKVPHHQYFLVLTGLLALSSILVLVFMKKLNRFSVASQGSVE